jgi:hypothetical protein
MADFSLEAIVLKTVLLFASEYIEPVSVKKYCLQPFGITGSGLRLKTSLFGVLEDDELTSDIAISAPIIIKSFGLFII